MQKLVRRRPAIDSSELLQADIHPLLARVYSARGIGRPNELALDLKHLIPPSELLNCMQGAELLADALATDQRMLIVGDFDRPAAHLVTQ